MVRRLLVLAALAGAPCLAPAAAAAPPARPPAQARDTPPGDQGDCDRKWRDYAASQRCFARFRTAHRGLKPEAFAVCGPALPDPSRECPLRTP